MQYDKTFKEEAVRLSDEIGPKKAAEQLGIHVDETPVQVLKEPGRKAKTKSYMWVFASSKYATDAHHIHC